jgi:two-component system cell cycle sensor histidine kinase PleC
MISPCARDLAVWVAPVSPGTTCAAVFERLLSEPDARSIPVVKHGRPIGIVSRKNFLLTYVRMYGAEIYGRKPITRLMERDVLIVDAETRCEAINDLARTAFGEERMRPFLVTENGIYAGVGDAPRLMMVMADLATSRAAALEEETRRAEAASASKTQFLANMSHELRTPLNAIIGFADLMRQKMLGEISPGRYGEYVDDIYSSGVHLLGMINELLDMAKIESGHVELRETAFHPMEIGFDVLRMLRQSIADARLDLRIDVPEDLPFVLADQDQIRRVLINLLSNAIKYTPPGGTVTLRLCMCPDAHGCGGEGMRLTVEDTGVGIPAHKLEKVLEPFEQVENSFTRSRPGTGLGLSLSRAMIEAHGGRLWLESVLGAGTKAHALLPAERIVHGGSELAATA